MSSAVGATYAVLRSGTCHSPRPGTAPPGEHPGTRTSHPPRPDDPPPTPRPTAPAPHAPHPAHEDHPRPAEPEPATRRPLCWPCANRSSSRSSPASAAHAGGANLSPGPASTATTRRSASTCRPSSTVRHQHRTSGRRRLHARTLVQAELQVLQQLSGRVTGPQCLPCRAASQQRHRRPVDVQPIHAHPTDVLGQPRSSPPSRPIVNSARVTTPSSTTASLATGRGGTGRHHHRSTPSRPRSSPHQGTQRGLDRDRRLPSTYWLCQPELAHFSPVIWPHLCRACVRKFSVIWPHPLAEPLEPGDATANGRTS